MSTEAIGTMSGVGKDSPLLFTYINKVTNCLLNTYVYTHGLVLLSAFIGRVSLCSEWQCLRDLLLLKVLRISDN